MYIKIITEEKAGFKINAMVQKTLYFPVEKKL